MGSRFPLPRGFGVYEDRVERIRMMRKYAMDRGWRVAEFPSRGNDDEYAGPPDPAVFPNFGFDRDEHEHFVLYPTDYDAPTFPARFTELIGDPPGFVARKAVGSE